MSGGYNSLGADVSGSVPAAAAPDHIALQFQDSNLQTFPPSDARGKLMGSSKPPREADDTFSRPAAEPEQSGWHGYFNLISYRPYFNVDTIDVLQRIADSMIPFKGDFVEKTSSNPDMYGPFWICTTLIFVTAALGNFAAYLAHKASASDSKWHYDINKVSWSAGLFYGYVGVLPVALYFLLKYLGVSTGLAQLWCLYGYSLFIFIPTSVLSVVPVEKFKWAVVAAAAGLSATFLALNIRTHIKTASERWFLIVCGCFVLQLGLGLLMKLYFFTVNF